LLPQVPWQGARRAAIAPASPAEGAAAAGLPPAACAASVPTSPSAGPLRPASRLGDSTTPTASDTGPTTRAVLPPAHGRPPASWGRVRSSSTETRRPLFVHLPANAVATRSACQAHGHLVEPVCCRFLPANGTGLSGQDEEGRLEAVLRVVLVTDDTP